MDHITITDLRLHLPHGLSPSQSAFALDPPPACPVVLNLRIDMHDGIVQGDDGTMLGLGVNYSSVVKDIYQMFSAAQQAGAEKRWKGHKGLMRDVAAIPLALEAVKGVKVELVLERAALYAESVAYVAYFGADQRGEQEGQQGQGQGQGEGSRNASMRREMSSVECRDIKVICVVGLHPYERRERQRLELDLKVQPDLEGLDTKALIGAAVEYVEQSNFGTIESLSHTLAERLLPLLGTPATPVSLTVAIRKPSANPWSVPGITITRSTPDISSSAAPSASSTAPSTSTATTTSIQASSHSSSSSSRSRVFLALGSNIEPRLPHLLRAIRSLQSSGCTLISTGKLYESEPMYHTDQSRFLNSAIEVQTTLEPMELLKLLKKVEREVGREKTFENGPRVVDVDLIYYGGRVENVGKKGDEEVQGVGWLEVPHWGRREREFVLRPLCDIYPTFIDPILRIPLATLLARLPSYPPQLAPVIPFHPPSSLLRLEPSSSPAIMAIFNATPDSFSDGSSSRLDVQSCLAEVSSLFDQPHPPAILDIGGMSTRPGSEPCSEAEELERVVPLIQAIRTSGRLCANIPISVDTYRPAVARAAVQAGASSINDVRGGREEGMLKTMAELDVPVFLMHSRGDSSSMTTPSAQNYAPLGVVEGVRREMVTMVRKALTAGVKRWNIILDPGLGFAKSPQDSLVLLKEIDKLTAKGTELYGLPVLVGASRKGFVGKAIGRETPLERGYGDAAVASWCVAKGVDVLRVHDVRAAGDVLAMTRAISQA